MQKDMESWIEEIREMFRTLDWGEESPSPYDTAWICLIPAVDGSEGPQFPKSLQWIVENQFEDGSWGLPDFFRVSNNVLNTLACLIALKKWNIAPDSIIRGENFLRKNMDQMEDDPERTCGFELAFTALIDDAKQLDLDLPYHLEFIEQMRATKAKKLQKLPLDVVHKIKTTVLYSLEGVQDIVDWEQIQNLQSENGSFLESVASTACAYLRTGNKRCLEFLTAVLAKNNDTALTIYPVDIFEPCWMVDRLQRLGLARYFESEIDACMQFVYKQFSQENGRVGWVAAKGAYTDMDDTAMAFRLLRLHGFDVNSTDSFEWYRTPEGGWCCLPGELSLGTTNLFSFFRACETGFPEEADLIEGLAWTRKLLLDRFKKNDLRDKYVISKTLASEVVTALANPWSQTMPRMEHRAYIDNYGTDDVWIGKVLYRLPKINNTTFLKLAKADFNMCQKKHQEELKGLLRWNRELVFKSERCADDKTLIICFFAGAGCLPAPQLSLARRAFTQLCLLTVLLDDFFDSTEESLAAKAQFFAACRSRDPKLMDGAGSNAQLLFESMYGILSDVIVDGSFLQGRDISQAVYDAWFRLVECHLKQAEWKDPNIQLSLEEYLEVAGVSISMEAVASVVQYFLGENITEEMSQSPHTKRLTKLMNTITRHTNDMATFQKEKLENTQNLVSISTRDGATHSQVLESFRKLVDDQMRRLVKEVLCPSETDGVLPKAARQFYFDFVRATLYSYSADLLLTSEVSERDGIALPAFELHDLARKMQFVNRILFEPVLY
ncbi:protein MpTPS7 [Marchantia polymorpha subsp. ruderalis]|uniref:Terpentedienol synthase n=1 Tax=Marchantia polymorpha TaxID=3197 RepID=A0A2R6VZS5_MARPO|nr:hypothetical protein MARPO_0221s0001 [Marchantia polymorpha]UPQ49786.1 terpentedienol synthase [Marchantia polymorpha]BBN03577.1 hypothetical protein Mp_2g24630 [Marchantia polymorpha subsp. ruderalis]|eukprot:PTQ27106.1 hypothetical protein MARPO_0221s0001 [Marchantia polymorpha]